MGLLELTSDNFQIFSSSLVGSYFFIRGLSLFIGYYPNELEIAFILPYQTNNYQVSFYLSLFYILSILF